MELTIPNKWVGYLCHIIGYSTGDNVKAQFIDQNGIPRWEWTEFLDTEAHTNVIPFLEKFYKGTIKFRFINSASSSRSIGLYVVILLIPEQNRIAFENAVKDLAELIPLLRTLKEQIITPVGVVHG